jgi:hypothetical protein
MRPRWGKANDEESTMSTTMLPETATKLPEWRRLCHWYLGDEQISVCGTARRKPGHDHSEADCAERGHTICVVCEALL